MRNRINLNSASIEKFDADQYEKVTVTEPPKPRKTVRYFNLYNNNGHLNPGDARFSAADAKTKAGEWDE